jgi:hypothetical protein
MKKEGIDFTDKEQVSQLLTGLHPVAAALMQASVMLMRTVTAAENAMIARFCAERGIEISPPKNASERAALSGTVELVCDTRARTAQHKDGRTVRVMQEAWCVDRREGRTGYEKTLPRVVVFQDNSNVTVETMESEWT